MAPAAARKLPRKAVAKVAVRDEPPVWEPVAEWEPTPPPPAPPIGFQRHEPDAAAPPPVRLREPVWLVRIVLLLFLVGFAAFLAREVSNFLTTLP